MERRNPFIHLDPYALPSEGNRPLEICLVRGQGIESRHRVHVLALDSQFREVHRWGDSEFSFFPRSAVKMMQAAAWVSRGVLDKASLTAEELALACSSHHGEPDHIQAVQGWLRKIGAQEDCLECGIHFPYHEESERALLRSGHEPSQIHNNCSGKHTGFLAFCRVCGWDFQGYSNYDHPVQAAIRETLGEFFGLEISQASWGIDGCGIPTYRVSLESMARAAAKLASPGLLRPELAEAVRILNSAIASNPRFIGGTNSFCSKVVSETEGRVFAKLGAEGEIGRAHV